jgi:ABC-type dipeptide/oligopeptide/nickel transport system permease subunit
MAGLTQEALVTSEAPGEAPGPGQDGGISGRSPLRIAFDRIRKDKIAVVCFFIVLFFALIAIFAGVIADLFGVSLESVRASERVDLATGLPLEGPPNHGFDPDHPFGVAPKSGNDLLAYWLYGARTSLIIATIAVVVATFIGVVLGLIAGYAGGVADRIIQFFTDVFLTLPFLLMALAIAPILSERFGDNPELYEKASFYSVIGILSFFTWMQTARIIRGEVLSLREREFVQAARVLGVPTHRILSREILPNLVAPIVVVMSLGLPAFIAFEAVLAFLGIGVTGRPSWGQTINAAIPYFENYPLYLWEPVLGIVLLVVALNLLGDAVRDALDPKTRR